MVWNLGLIQNTEIQNVVHSIAEFVYYMLYYYSASSIYINKEGRHSGDWKLELFFIIVQWKQCATTHIILQAYHLLLYIEIAGSAHSAQIYDMHGICWTGGGCGGVWVEGGKNGMNNKRRTDMRLFPSVWLLLRDHLYKSYRTYFGIA